MSEHELVPLPEGTVSAKAKKLEKFLKSRVKGQSRALRYVYEYFEVLWANLKDPKRPIAVFIFLGPSGVGKTETARALAEYLFGDPDAMTLVACGNIEHGHEISVLLGAPPGYIGHNNPALLSHWNVYKHHIKHLCLTGEYFEIGLKKSSEKIKRFEKKKNELEAEADILIEKLIRLSKELEDCETELEKYERFCDDEDPGKTRDYKERIENYERAIIRLKKALTKNEAKRETVLKEYQEFSGVLEGFKKIQEKPPEERFNSLAAWIEENKFFFGIGEEKAILLFDEIEKSAESTHHVLLQIMEEGRVTLNSPAGAVTDLRNCIIIMTSNLGGNDIVDLLSGGENRIGFRAQCPFSPEELDQKIYELSLETLRRFFDPEFINRINKKIVFRPLDRSAMLEILEQRISESNSQNPIKLELDEKVKNFIVDETLKHPADGARLLKDRIVQFLVVEIAPMINEEILKENDVVVVKLDKSEKEKLLFYRKK